MTPGPDAGAGVPKGAGGANWARRHRERSSEEKKAEGPAKGPLASRGSATAVPVRSPSLGMKVLGAVLRNKWTQRAGGLLVKGAVLLNRLGKILPDSPDALTALFEQLPLSLKVFPALKFLKTALATPSVQEFKELDGRMIGCGCPKTDPAPAGQVPPPIGPGGKADPGAPTVFYVNGINTTPEQACTTAKSLAAKGMNVVAVYNAHEGFASDVVQTLDDKSDLGANPSVDALTEQILAKVRRGEEVNIIAHSQGGAITSRALLHARQTLEAEKMSSESDGDQRSVDEMMSLVSVQTFGSAAGSYPDGPRYRHTINKNDPTPQIVGIGPDAKRGDKVFGTSGDGEPALVNRIDVVNAVDPNPFTGPHSMDDVYMNEVVVPPL